jgi:hypothetical protein
VHLPEYYFFSTLRHLNQFHGFGEYNHFEITSEFYSHLTVTPKLEDLYISKDSNCVFYVPVICDVKTSPKKWVVENFKELQLATNLSAIFLTLITATRYQIDFLSEKEQDSTVFPSFGRLDKEVDFIEAIQILADF